MQYNITLSSAEDKALSYAAVSQNDWIQNAVKQRCKVAIEEIVSLAVNKCMETSTPIPSTRDEIVELAFAQGWVRTAAEIQSEFEAEQAARAAQE